MSNLAVQATTGSDWGGPVAIAVAIALFAGAVKGWQWWTSRHEGAAEDGPAELEAAEPDDLDWDLDDPDGDPGREPVEDHGTHRIAGEGNYTSFPRRPWQ